MIEIKLQNILNREERSLNWVSIKTGIAYSTLHKLNNNNTTSISFNTLDALCKLFKCKLTDIIDFVDEEKR
ncbi:helix-turn-helix domain-containing protein [Clostridium pasteurianum]|uniref:Putative transcriptional regulator n=1 Tax=Clostridium pasteurianum BC1 TaxID=86416 RepID=R4K509_CLOPA|nr:helix-turn-helix transcriptional regulator [Clostridium pasteurianum]AGK97653.1 putative transcriptional regulator [Clostridium pasteurianum BC1]